MHTQILPYPNDSANLFEHFEHLPHAIFLDSCQPEQSRGRYDIISAMPIKIINGQSAAIFTEIENTLKEFKIRDNTSYPFSMGAIGYLSYDFGRQLEKIPTIAKDDIDIPIACVGIYDWSIVVDHFEKKTILHAINTEKAQLILTLLKTDPPAKIPFLLSNAFQSNMSKDYYQTAFDEIKKNIIAGNCYQVNFAQRFSAAFSGSPWEAYKTLRKKNPAPFSAYVNLRPETIMDHNDSPLIKSNRNTTTREHQEENAILCCSPERFLKIENNLVETKPIKGTSKRFAETIEDQASATALLNSEKDRAENVMIVDLLRNDLSRTCTDVTVQKLCGLESFSNVHHLVSTITANLTKNTSPLSVFKNCFPGGSITGAPKIASMKIIESLEPHRRSIYCGSIFYADINGNFDSNIVIRTAICNKAKIHCYAGGGIVYDSDCESEYAETLIKINRIIKTLQNQR